ncbi:MAG: PEGA domain-containing protein [Pseudobacter sp.]|uniref:PEGA domain-containing protein n=1 Tax=Pseudobacter sp. TaxID=2045420 RepID=UPI003F7F7D6A
MKKQLLFWIGLILCQFAIAQNGYVQVKGEPGLSVYLNGSFKCKTTAELKGCIIEGVTPGNNTIRVVKEGYTPYEETITVGKGEVLAYTVKPFSKHTVEISESGNSAESEKKAAIQTGKLIIQSLPIEINITIPQIEGVKDLAKTRDQWTADKIPAGNYEVSFKFNGKVITKKVTVSESNTTSVFINMLSGEFTSKNTLDAKQALALEKQEVHEYIDSIMQKYRFRPYLSLDEFVAHCQGAAKLLSSPDRYSKGYYSLTDKNLRDPANVPGYSVIGINNNMNELPSHGKVWTLTYTLLYTKNYTASKTEFERIRKLFKSKVSVPWFDEASTRFGIDDPLSGAEIKVELQERDKGYYELMYHFQQLE